MIGAVRLSNGDIVLGEWASGELRRYDRKGTFMWRAGGQGEGPGEHAFMTFVGLLPGDSVVTYDGALRRVQVFGPDGVVARTMSIESPWSGFPPARVVGVSERRLVMTFEDQQGEIPVGVVRWPGIRITTLSLEDGAVATVMDIPGAEQYITRTGSSISNRGYEFGRGPKLAMTGGRLALVDTEVFSVRSVSLDDGATTAILRRDEPAQEVTSEHVEAYVEWMARRNVAYGGYSEEQAEASKAGLAQGTDGSHPPGPRVDPSGRGRKPLGGAVCRLRFRKVPLRGLHTGRHLAGVRRHAAGAHSGRGKGQHRPGNRRGLRSGCVERGAGG